MAVILMRVRNGIMTEYLQIIKKSTNKHVNNKYHRINHQPKKIEHTNMHLSKYPCHQISLKGK